MFFPQTADLSGGAEVRMSPDVFADLLKGQRAARIRRSEVPELQLKLMGSRSEVSKSASRSGSTAGWGEGGFSAEGSCGKYQNRPSSLSVDSPPTPPAAHNTTDFI